MVLNARKCVCMVFPPRDSSKVVSSSFPPLCVGNDLLHFVPCFKYLGHKMLMMLIFNVRELVCLSV